MNAEDIQTHFDRSPFSSFLHLRVISAGEQSLTVRMPMRPEICRSGGKQQFHGGAIATLIDVTGDYAVALLAGGPVPTVKLDVDYLRPATGEWLQALAMVRRKGRTLSTVDIEVVRDDGELVALGRAVYVSSPG